MPTYHLIEEAPDGSVTAWFSEHDPLQRMKGMVGICLYPGKAFYEMKVQLFNRTPEAQTFLWWVNVGVHVHDDYQAVFPPDVTVVTDHSKRSMSHFPIAKGTYYGVDYDKDGQGTDISWYKNVPNSTSYFVWDTDYDYFGGYDHRATRASSTWRIATSRRARRCLLGARGSSPRAGRLPHRWGRPLHRADGRRLHRQPARFLLAAALRDQDLQPVLVSGAEDRACQERQPSGCRQPRGGRWRGESRGSRHRGDARRDRDAHGEDPDAAGGDAGSRARRAVCCGIHVVRGSCRDRFVAPLCDDKGTKSSATRLRPSRSRPCPRR